MSSGGRRVGAGRKSKFGEKTVALRIPESMLEFVQKQLDFVQNQVETLANESDLLGFESVQNQVDNVTESKQINIESVQNQKIVSIQEIIDKYEANANDSPRWTQAKKLIADLKAVTG